MKNISDITDPGASFNTEQQKDISNCPLNLQQMCTGGPQNNSCHGIKSQPGCRHQLRFNSAT